MLNSAFQYCTIQNSVGQMNFLQKNLINCERNYVLTKLYSMNNWKHPQIENAPVQTGNISEQTAAITIQTNL